jgi:Cysteine-rich secretory protein family
MLYPCLQTCDGCGVQDPTATLDAHNNFRRLHGVPDLSWDTDLEQVASDWVRPYLFARLMKPQNQIRLVGLSGARWSVQ